MLNRRDALIGTAIVLVAATLFGTLGPLSRFAYAAGLAPFAFVAWRAAIGTLGIGMVNAARPGGSPLAILAAQAGSAKRAMLLAAVVGAALNLCIFAAFDRTTVALALLGFYTYPAMVAVASVVLGHERLDLPRALALALALGGMTAVVLGGGDAPGPGEADPAGIVLALAAAAFQATFVLSSRGYRRVPTDVAMGTILAGSAFFAAAATVVTAGAGALALPLQEPALLGLLLVVGILAAALPSVLFLTGIRRIGPLRTGIVMLFEPVVGVVLAAILLGESLSLVQAVGGATILLAALLAQRGMSGSVGAAAQEGGAGTLADTEQVVVLPVPGGP